MPKYLNLNYSFFFYLVLLEDAVEADIRLTGFAEANYLRRYHFTFCLLRNSAGTACTWSSVLHGPL